MIFCGLPGDDEHRERLTRATRQIALSASQVFGIAEEQRIVLAGDDQMVELNSVGANLNSFSNTGTWRRNIAVCAGVQ